jgi:hypothetical protein
MKKSEVDPFKAHIAFPEQVARARAEYANNSDDNIEIDDDAVVVPTVDGGSWIQAWVWLSEEYQS